MNFDDIDSIEENSNYIKQLFVDRDKAYTTATQQIVDEIADTVIEALLQVFDVDVSNVTWSDFQSTDDVLIVICGVKYNVDAPPKFIKQIGAADKGGNTGEVTQVLRIGIPHELVTLPPEYIIEYMHLLTKDQVTSESSRIQTLNNERPLEYINNNLTPEQKQQMLFLSHTTEGKIH